MMSFPQQPNFLFFDSFGTDSDNSLVPAASNAHHSLAMTTMSADATAAHNGNTMNAAYFISGSHLMAAGHAGMYPPTVAMIDAHQQQQQQFGASAAASVPATVAAAATGGAVGAEHRRSPSSTRSVSSIDTAQRRATHNAIERARRESLNGQFQDLASAVPALIHVRRPSKATIVEKSLEYIHSFKEHLGNRDQIIKRMQMRNAALHSEVNRLRKQLGLEPLAETPENAAAGSATISEAPEDMLLSKPSENKRLVARPSSSANATSRSAAANSVPLLAKATDKQQKPNDVQQHKRRQQSLDFGISEHSTGRPMLRVRTSNIKKAEAKAQASGRESSSASSSPLNISPLSAPVISHSSQLPFSAAAFSMTAVPPASDATAAAVAAYVAHNNAIQQHMLSTMPVTSMAPAQFGSMGMGASFSSMQVNPMGYIASPGSSAGAALGVIDMNKLTEALATTAACSMPMAAPVETPSSSASPLASMTGAAGSSRQPGGGSSQ
ncbi:hypothetical protein BX070DRAFT_85554 [Coemansia spiralis]|nr:hypothetical protein BX070DRAFT_85554 [Coemansia spiralis]